MSSALDAAGEEHGRESAGQPKPLSCEVSLDLFQAGFGDEDFLLSLPLGCPHRDPIKIVAHLDLARQARIWFHLEGKIEHILLHWGGSADLFPPCLVDIDMTGRAGAGAAALRLDLGNAMLDCSLHDRGTDLAFDGARGAP